MRHSQGRPHLPTATGQGLLFKKASHWVPFIGSSSLGGVCNCRGIMRQDNLSAETPERIQIHRGVGGVTGTELNERRKHEPYRLGKLKQAAIQSGEV